MYLEFGGRVPGAERIWGEHRQLSRDVIPAESHDNSTSAAPGNSSSGSNNTPMIIGFAVVAVVLFTVSGFCFLRNRRATRLRKQKYQQAPLHDPSDGYRSGVTAPTITTGGATAATNLPTVAVDRTLSIRSIMTLPAYRPKASGDEQVLGREGERDGVDTVVELPTEQDMEELRENEMESLYQIRLARTREARDREERRRQRREARQNNDVAALREIQEQRRLAQERNEVGTWRDEHNRLKDQRNRTVPSVAYADVGIARHDGTRVRGTSMESERVGLLSDAASISVSMRSPAHGRNRSGSVLSENSENGSGEASSSHRRSGSFASQLPSAGLVGASIGTARNSISTHRPSTEDIMEEGPLSPPEYDEISLGTITPRPSTDTRAPLVPDDPPPTYAGDVRSGSLDEWPSAPGHQESVPTVNVPENSQAMTENPSRVSATPLRLPSLRLAELPRIVVQPSPTDLQAARILEDGDEAGNTRTGPTQL